MPKFVNHDLIISDTLKLRVKNHSPRKNSKNVEIKESHEKESLHYLTKIEMIIFEIILISPVLIALSVLYTTHQFLLTLAIFHLALVGFPIIFLLKKGLFEEFITLLRKERVKTQYKRIFTIALIIPCIVLYSSYWILKNNMLQDVIQIMRIPNMNNISESILLFIDFVIINPFVEEFFWRIFCHMFVSEKTEAGKFQIAIHFAFYHWFIIYFIFQNGIIATLGFSGLTIIGYILTHMKIYFGILLTISFHVGMDLAVAFVLIDVFCNNSV